MITLLHHILDKNTDAIAVRHKQSSYSYRQLGQKVKQQAQALVGLKLAPQQRVAIYLPKQIETVSSFFSTSQAGGVFVPVNPVLKANQVKHILTDCQVRILITSSSRLQGLNHVLLDCPDLQSVIVVDQDQITPSKQTSVQYLGWQDFLAYADSRLPFPPMIDTHIASILYTSGSTGKPKGVVLSHRNIIAGAQSTADYLKISSEDKLLAVLPFSFDYGLNQLISALHQGAECILLDYLLPRDVIKALKRYQITGLAAVPPLWAQLAKLEWSEGINQHLRYLTNSGGKMPKAILNAIRAKVPDSQFYLMYGLTEAFRSTYLPPEQIEQRPDSIGKAIPNAEILVVKKDGCLCSAHETGELVHRGSLVAQGYWNDPEKTAERFKPAPGQLDGLPLTEIAVWSGDQVYADEEGYLYFVGRQDDMLKTSGYRVSPSEIEEFIYSTGLVKEVAAIGIADDALGQKIIAVVSVEQIDLFDAKALINQCKAELANFMVPTDIVILSELPKNPNGKIDRQQLTRQLR